MHIRAKTNTPNVRIRIPLRICSFVIMNIEIF